MSAWKTAVEAMRRWARRMITPIPLEPQVAREGAVPKVWASRCWGCPRGLHAWAPPYSDGDWWGRCTRPGGPRVGHMQVVVATMPVFERMGEDSAAAEAAFALAERPAWCRLAGAREQALQFGLPSGARW